MFGAFGIGRAMGTVPDFSKAKEATAELFRLVDREPEIDTFSDDGEKPVSNQVSGADPGIWAMGALSFLADKQKNKR